MSGGTFTSTNKVRPGAYINFKAVQKPISGIGTRGIVAIPAILGWGPENTVIEVYSTDIANGSSLLKLGHLGSASQIQIIREALKNAYKALVYRLDTGGTKATAVIENLTAMAKYPGTVGNRISIVIKAVDSGYEVQTLVDTQIKERQVCETVEELRSNDWVDFTGSGSLNETAGVTLTSGEDGSVTQESYSAYLSAMKNKTWNTMACPSLRTSGKGSDINQSVLSYIKGLREHGRKVQAVVNGYPDANYEGIISVNQGYLTADETVTMDSFVGYYAGLTAGSSVNQSNTYKLIEGALSILNPLTDEEIEAGLRKGKTMLSYRSDGAVVVEQDINTLYEPNNDVSDVFAKNRVIRCLDDINNYIKQLFENTFIGKVDNSDNGRSLLKSHILSYLGDLARMGAIETINAEDITVSAGNDISGVVIELSIQPVDAMEKLYMTVNL